MRILLYGYEYPPLGTGTGNALKNMFEHFSKIDDLEIDFVTSSLDDKYKEESPYKNIRFYRIPTGVKDPEEFHSQKPKNMVLYTIRSYLLTWKLISKHKYDLNHFFGFPGGLVSLLFRWRMKYIISLRGVDVPGYNEKFKKYYFFYKPLSWVIWRFAEKVIVNSKELADLARNTSSKIDFLVIPNGVNVERFKPVIGKKKYKSFSITPGGTRLIQRKGINYLIRGFAKFLKEEPDAKLVLIGNGDSEEKLKTLVKELKIGNSVIFKGRMPNSWIQAELPKFHVYCLPSLNEGMCNALLEALACGLPIVSTDTGGAKEILDGNGYIIRKKDSLEIYEYIKKLYNNEKLRLEMGNKSRKIAEDMSWENVVNSYFKTYRSLL